MDDDWVNMVALVALACLGIGSLLMPPSEATQSIVSNIATGIVGFMGRSLVRSGP